MNLFGKRDKINLFRGDTPQNHEKGKWNVLASDSEDEKENFLKEKKAEKPRYCVEDSDDELFINDSTSTGNKIVSNNLFPIHNQSKCDISKIKESSDEDYSPRVLKEKNNKGIKEPIRCSDLDSNKKAIQSNITPVSFNRNITSKYSGDKSNSESNLSENSIPKLKTKKKLMKKIKNVVNNDSSESETNQNIFSKPYSKSQNCKRKESNSESNIVDEKNEGESGFDTTVLFEPSNEQPNDATKSNSDIDLSMVDVMKELDKLYNKDWHKNKHEILKETSPNVTRNLDFSIDDSNSDHSNSKNRHKTGDILNTSNIRQKNNSKSKSKPKGNSNSDNEDGDGLNPKQKTKNYTSKNCLAKSKSELTTSNSSASASTSQDSDNYNSKRKSKLKSHHKDRELHSNDSSSEEDSFENYINRWKKPSIKSPKKEIKEDVFINDESEDEDGDLSNFIDDEASEEDLSFYIENRPKNGSSDSDNEDNTENELNSDNEDHSENELNSDNEENSENQLNSDKEYDSNNDCEVDTNSVSDNENNSDIDQSFSPSKNGTPCDGKDSPIEFLSDKIEKGKSNKKPISNDSWRDTPKINIKSDSDTESDISLPLPTPFRKKNILVKENTSCRKTHSFLASLTTSIPNENRHPDAVVYIHKFKKNYKELANKLFKLFNETVFENLLQNEEGVLWNPRLTKTGGQCKCKKRQNKRSFSIELSTKVIDSAERLRDTLIHEMCHAATWIISEDATGHGPKWKSWTRRAMNKYPELPPITRCHSYEIKCKYIYKCNKCSYSIGRHSKSLDVNRFSCGKCGGNFELQPTGNSKQPSYGAIPKTPKTPGPFALYVKENYGSIKKSSVDFKHRDIMKVLGAEFAKLKTSSSS